MRRSVLLLAGAGVLAVVATFTVLPRDVDASMHQVVAVERTPGTPASVARATVHAVQGAGADHVAPGADWDGAVVTGFDASELALVTAARLDAGLREAVMGENVLALLARTLPAS